MIYYDNAATTPPIFQEGNEFTANPASPHLPGIEAERKLSSAKEKLAGLIQCKPNEIYFTSGGTESNNLALFSALKTFSKRGGIILTTPYEHPSVSEPLKEIRKTGSFSVIEAPLTEWEKCIAENTDKDFILASCSQVNHETGDINDVERYAGLLKALNPGIIFHADGAQGFCKENLSLKNVDLYSFSAHKFHGPLGVGGLVVKSGVRLAPLLYGGSQQNSLRPGTVNVRGIQQTADAAGQMYINMKEHRQNVLLIKESLIRCFQNIPNVLINEGSKTSPYILNASFMGIKGETLVHMLSQNGVHASMGAACNTGKKSASLLERMGYGKGRASSAVRFSFSHLNTLKEAETAKKIINGCVNKLRDMLDR